MKYLEKREEFLKQSLTKINEYRKLEPINEEMESGPFANDIPWGDSLLGRLINSSIRKAKIGANLVRIKTVERRLRDAFDEIIAMSKINEDEATKKEFAELMNFSFLYNLEKAVKDNDELVKIKNLTNEAIKEVDKNKEIPDREELLRQLNEFKKFLDGIEGEKEEPEQKSSYNTYLENFKTVFNIVQEYAKLKATKPESSDSNIDNLEVGKEYVYTNKKGEKSIVKIVDKVHPRQAGNDKEWLTDDDVVDPQKIKQPGVYVVWKRGKVYPSNAPAQTVDPSSLSPIEGNQGVPVKVPVKAPVKSPVKTYDNYSFINEAEENTKILVLKPIKSLYDYFNQDKGSIIKDLDTFFNQADDKYRNNSKFKSPIEKIYSRIKSKGGVNEDINQFLTRPEAIGDKIFELYQVTKTKEDGSFEGINDSMKKAIAEFNRTMKEIIKPKTEEVKTESIFRYSDFINRIFEAEEETTEAPAEPAEKTEETPESKPNKIQDWWNKNMNLDKWMKDKIAVEKIKSNLDKKLEEKQDSVIIDGIDPVLEIVKCFNRAYKIHTTQVIPSGRTGGKVSNQTFREYTSFGGGSPESAGSSGGPYRNNAIFDQWEKTVLDIKGERKYQPIFNKGTKLRMGEEMIENAGANLAKFMRDMLDGDDLYKTSKDPKGSQAKFLEKYFGYVETDPTKIANDTYFSGSTEMKNNQENANKIKNITLQFSKNPITFENYEDLKGTFFATYLPNGTEKYPNSKEKYFFIQEIDKEYAYLTYCSSFYFMKMYIDRTGVITKTGNLKGDIPLNGTVNLKPQHGEGEEKSTQYIIKALRVKLVDLIEKNGKFKIDERENEAKYLTKYDGKVNNSQTQSKLVGDVEVFLVKGCYTLCDMSGNISTPGNRKRYKLEKDISEQIRQLGGFPTVKGSNEIANTYLKKK